MTDDKLSVAMLGIRGIPANYGGFETCVEEIAPRIAALGHEVTVYCRSQYLTGDLATYRGVSLRKLPTIPNKYLDTPVHSLLSSAHAMIQGYDVVFVFGVGNSPVAALLRAGRTPVVLNVDGLDWQRDKWPWFAKAALRLAERIAGSAADRVVTDSLHVQHYYRRLYGAELSVVPYGSDPKIAHDLGVLPELGLTPGQYVLYVGRLEPENNIHTLIEASRLAALGVPTVIVGDAPYSDPYKSDLEALAGDEVIFAGARYGDAYWALNQNAGLYVFPVMSSGTHPALIEAMACGNHVLARDTPDNRAVGGDAVDYFTDARSLADLLDSSWNDPVRSDALGEAARARALYFFNWERVSRQYLDLARDAIRQRKRRKTIEEAPDMQRETSVLADITGALSHFTFPNGATERLPASLDAGAFKRGAALHGVGPLLGHRVEDGDLAISPEIDSWLREQASLNRKRLSLLRSDLLRILDAFRHYEIEAIPLKGTAMLLDGSRDIGWRPMADLDLLARHPDQQLVDLAYARAGYCLPATYSTGLSGLDWKHRHYRPCEREWPSVDALGEHPDHPRDVESHPAVAEMHQGIRWDITRWITSNLVTSEGYVIPNSQALSLHLAVHCSINVLESRLRLIHLVDMEAQIERAGTDAILTAVHQAGARRHARFVYPALALTARWSGNLSIARAASLLEPYVPIAMAEWCATASLDDLSWKPDRSRPLRMDLSRWPVAPVERLRVLGNTILPPPRELDSQGYKGQGARAILGWYPRYYREQTAKLRGALDGLI
ncbi:MAG: nucleotidyltransferase family protein [Chloroflexota bacterium]